MMMSSSSAEGMKIPAGLPSIKTKQPQQHGDGSGSNSKQPGVLQVRVSCSSVSPASSSSSLCHETSFVANGSVQQHQEQQQQQQQQHHCSTPLVLWPMQELAALLAGHPSRVHTAFQHTLQQCRHGQQLLPMSGLRQLVAAAAPTWCGDDVAFAALQARCHHNVLTAAEDIDTPRAAAAAAVDAADQTDLAWLLSAEACTPSEAAAAAAAGSGRVDMMYAEVAAALLAAAATEQAASAWQLPASVTALLLDIAAELLPQPDGGNDAAARQQQRLLDAWADAAGAPAAELPVAAAVKLLCKQLVGPAGLSDIRLLGWLACLVRQQHLANVCGDSSGACAAEQEAPGLTCEQLLAVLHQLAADMHACGAAPEVAGAAGSPAQCCWQQLEDAAASALDTAAGQAGGWQACGSRRRQRVSLTSGAGSLDGSGGCDMPAAAAVGHTALLATAAEAEAAAGAAAAAWHLRASVLGGGRPARAARALRPQASWPAEAGGGGHEGAVAVSCSCWSAGGGWQAGEQGQASSGGGGVWAGAQPWAGAVSPAAGATNVWFSADILRVSSSSSSFGHPE